LNYALCTYLRQTHFWWALHKQSCVHEAHGLRAG